MEPEFASQLVEAARTGDERAWRTIVAELGPALVGYARSKGVPDPEDLMQEVFVALAERLADFEGSWRRFRSWAFTIAHHKMADHHRSRSRRPRLVPMEVAAGMAGGPTPSDELEMIDERERSLTALDRLSPVEREVILLRVVAELDSEQVGEILGKRPGTVRVIQSRATTKMKQMMQEG